MDLKTFIAETLEQILAGIKRPSDGRWRFDRCGDVSRRRSVRQPHERNGGSPGIFTRVDFDVAISAETIGGGKAGLTVFGIGAEGKGEHKFGHANRISFSVPVRLPDGKQKPKRR
jgi:hypothetical protein